MCLITVWGCRECPFMYHQLCFVETGWEVAGEYIYTTPGNLDSDYMMLTLDVSGYR